MRTHELAQQKMMVRKCEWPWVRRERVGSRKRNENFLARDASSAQAAAALCCYLEARLLQPFQPALIDERLALLPHINTPRPWNAAGALLFGVCHLGCTCHSNQTIHVSEQRPA